ncbi:lysophospholipid acyltransferase family protein [Chitinophaga sancti]|uniref:Lysophospholipid acyltransferase family protein n=2 Tax=Chitinophaga sancti TaxID=1004 RepID=A0ABZ0XH44_9BACT|nr:lysophospholipid acyltransferase family protein [Chitinophaga sancti]WQD64414.1 lysophospholipid acyltransferase family protein [Chitinophaga sancti]WQG89962.1 lysophospholipid acyltransferase family protein [Chitinophaga sancti]
MSFSYYLLQLVAYGVARLPFRVLYLLSDVMYVLLYYVLSYRKKVVMTNLRTSFPEKSEKELKRICKDFYHYLCDMFLETFKTLTISREDMVKRCEFTPATIALFNQLAEDGKSVILVMGHKGNWEWAGNSFSILLKQQLYVIYHPLSNKGMDALMYKMRTRFGTKLYAMQDTFREMVKNRKEINATAFIADQSPQPATAHWTRFLNQDTPVFKGTEKIAQKMNYPIVYVAVNKVKRGYYSVEASMLIDEPTKLGEGEITDIHTQQLERDIIAQPSTWLWSHRRWKHKRQPQPQEEAVASI